jgi:hypothetical protein
LGGSLSDFPESDGPEFHQALAAKVQAVGKIWHPLHQRDEPLIDVSKLKPTTVGKKPKSSDQGTKSEGESTGLTWQVPVAIVILLLIAYLMPRTKISLICIALSIILGTMRYYSAI